METGFSSRGQPSTVAERDSTGCLSIVTRCVPGIQGQSAQLGMSFPEDL